MASKLETELSKLLETYGVKTILHRLRNELPKDLSYHTYEHTLDVVREALSLGIEDQLSDRELHLLGVAAAFHDAGFLTQRNENEKIGAKIALATLSGESSYSQDELVLIEQMILDTDVVRPPTHKLSKYLIDADLSNFGRDDFFEKSSLVAKENGVTDSKQFYNDLYNLLSQHVWYTDAAKKKRQAKKEENLNRLKNLF